MFYRKKSLDNEVKEAIKDKTLKTNLEKFFENYRESFRRAYEGLNIEQLREEVSNIKNLTAQERLKLFEEFKKNAEQSGAFVYQAKDSVDACQYIAEVCKKHNSEYVVKSKSMTAEEIGLNPFLEKEGIKPIETDLGEWIIQLAKERPSHMIMPAIHKNRHQVARLFENYTKEQVDENDIEKMVKIARKNLREFYFKANVGISGANIAIAQTGTVAIVTNEGNGRLVITIPPVHIVVLGYEKLVKNFSDALKILRVLPKNATGQIISVYVSWIKGAVDSIKNKGKKEIHFVFIDNGRLKLFDNQIFKEAYKCIRCGSCANVCPVYGVVGGHVFGEVYTGPIGVIFTAMYHTEKRANELLSMCTGCKACSQICPAKIDIQGLIEKLNSEFRAKYGIDPIKKTLFSKVLSSPTNLKVISKAANFISKPISKGGFFESSVLPKQHNFRVLPTIKKERFTDLFKKHNFHVEKPIKKVLFYPGCAIEYIYPEIGLALAKLLKKINIKVEIPEESVCCGLPAIHSGDFNSARKTVINNIKFMGKPSSYDYHIVLCPTCGSTIKKKFPELTEGLPNEYKTSKEISEKVIMFSELLEKLNVKLKVKNNLKCTYHKPCHQIRGLEFDAESFLESLLGKSFVRLPFSDACCGFGGSFSIDHALISKEILDKKIKNILSTGASIVLTECPGCIMQIQGGLKRKEIPIEVMHIARFIDKFVEI